MFWKQYTCPEGQINELASLTLNNKERVLNNLFSAHNKMNFGSRTLLVYGVIMFLLSAITFGTALPCGILLPQVNPKPSTLKPKP